MTQEQEQLSDNELVQLSKKDPESFGLLMTRYQERLFWYIRRLSFFLDEEIEDLLQEIFIKVYQNLNAYDQNLKFSSWIYRITHNHTIDAIRKSNSRPQKISGNSEEILKMIGDEKDLSKITENRDCLRKINQTILNLPIKYREVLVLNFLEEQSYEEIMDILKKPKGTIATLIRRGKALLKKELKKNGFEC